MVNYTRWLVGVELNYWIEVITFEVLAAGRAHLAQIPTCFLLILKLEASAIARYSSAISANNYLTILTPI